LPGNDLSADLQLLIEAAQEAGRIATPYSNADPEIWDKPDGAGPVTEADLAVNRMLEAELKAARPDYGWLSEESPPDGDRLHRDRVFIVDPIDGTRSFIEGSQTWAHSLAIAENGKVIAGVVFLPLRNKMYTGALGAGAALNGEPMQPSDQSNLAQASVLVAKPVMEARNWTVLPDFTRSHRPSIAYRLSLVAEGRFDAMVTLRPSWEWDIAAGNIIVQEAGAHTSDKTGAELQFNNPDPRQAGMLAANAPLHREVLGALR